MTKYKLHSTDKKTWFHFRSDMKSRCEAFTITYIEDGTVCMTGDYGTLTWKRDGVQGTDYGFPNKSSGISYFAEKVHRASISQTIKDWEYERAIKELKKELKDDEDIGGLEKLEDHWGEFETQDEFIRFLSNELELDCESYSIGEDYTRSFKFKFKLIINVSNRILKEISHE